MAETTTPKKRGRKAAAAGQPVTQEVVVMVPLAELHPFPDHPFQVRDDESMRETAASVKENGVIIPGLVRPREEGGYEIIAGHRRKHACELAGLTAMPVIVRDMDRDSATIGSRSDDADTFFAFQDVPAELIAPLVEARHMGGVGALHIDEHGIIDRVAVKAARGEILLVLIALEQLLDAIFDAVNDLPHPVFVGLLFSHDDLLSEKIAPLRRRKHILHRGDSPQIDVVFELADRMTQPLVIPHGKSLAARGFYALYLRRFQYCSRFRLASCFRRSCLAQAGQYLVRLEEK